MYLVETTAAVKCRISLKSIVTYQVYFTTCLFYTSEYFYLTYLMCRRNCLNGPTLSGLGRYFLLPDRRPYSTRTFVVRESFWVFLFISFYFFTVFFCFLLLYPFFRSFVFQLCTFFFVSPTPPYSIIYPNDAKARLYKPDHPTTPYARLTQTCVVEGDTKDTRWH